MHNGPNSLEVKNLSVVFRTQRGLLTAVNNISFSLERGEVLGIVGESACGKSMTALSILRLLPPGGYISSGEICFEGSNLLRLPHEKMRRIRGKRIAMIFQDPNTTLNPVRTIGTQFTETLMAHLPVSRAAAREKALTMLFSLGLGAPERVLRRYPFQLSGGMRQRVMIAMALALEPDFLIADEPTTALDVTVQAQILNEMKRLKECYGTGILLISHNMGVIAQLSDRVAVMYTGSIVEYGQAKTLFHRPAHPYTRGLLNSVPALRSNGELLHSIKGQPPIITNHSTGCPFAERCEIADIKCKDERPSLTRVGKNRQAACFFPCSV